MPKINFEGAKEILDNINDNDSVAVIHHDDGDGFCSGIIYYEWCKQKNAKVEEFTYTINKSKLKDWDLDKFNKLIVTDLASDFMTNELIGYDDKEILFLDHHPKTGEFDDNVNYLITEDEGYIPASRTAGELTHLRPLLALTGTITDMGQKYEENDDFIKEYLGKFDVTLDFFRQHVSSVISNTICYFENNSTEIFKMIKKIKTVDDIKSLDKYSEEVEGDIKKAVDGYAKRKERLGGINFYYFEPKFAIKGVVAAIIQREKKDGIYIFASPAVNNHGKISLSAREDDDKNLDLSELLKKAIEGLDGANAGGHPRAAGGAIEGEDLKRFKKNIRKVLR